VQKNALGIIALFAIPFGVQWFFVSGPQLMAPGVGNGLSWLVLLSACVAMFVGILFGAVYERLRRIKQMKSFVSESFAVFSEPGLYRALLASPILFSGVYTATLQTIDPVVALIFAFQNGFFCEAVLRKHAI
jgi:hypothetical protein